VVPAEDAQSFARETVRLLREPDLRREIGARGRMLVETRYVWADQLERLERLIEEAVPAPPRPAPQPAEVGG
jgi:glycosyltransferase involved in cell wall biosynthesis